MSPPTNQPTHQPTDQPTDQLVDVPADYVSVRLTIGEEQFKRFQTFMEDSMYIAYPHTGKKGTNPHYHILILSDKPEKFRKRIKDGLGLVGNKYVSVKFQHNGLLAGIQYCAREHTEPVCHPAEMSAYVDQAPSWVQSTIKDGESKRCKDKDWRLDYTNIVAVSVKHAQDNNLVEHSFRQVVEHLLDHTNWRPTFYMLCHGLPDYYENDYMLRLGRTKKRDMSWMNFRI